MPARPVYPWDQLRKEYVEGVANDDGVVIWPTIAQLAAKYEVRDDHVRRRSGKEHWLDKRALHQAELERARREARAKEYYDAAQRIDGRSLGVAEQGMQLVHARIQELITTQGQRLQAIANGQVVPASGAIDAMELTRLSLAGIRWHQLAMRAVGQEAERGGVGVAPGDASDMAAIVITERERALAETVGARVREAINVPSHELPTGGTPPPGAQRGDPSPRPEQPQRQSILDAISRTNGSNGRAHS
jgi:hypothetical protein